MKFNGAIIKVAENKAVSLAVVDEDFKTLPAEERIALTQKYMTAFPKGLPFLLLLVSKDGSREEFYGRPDLVAQVSEIPLNFITFKTYTTKED